MSKTNSVKTFSVGDVVLWQSQAAGTWKKKTGTVVEIVAARRTPKSMKRRNLSPRAGESYVVEVDVSPKKGGPRKMECYWPLVRNLRLVKRGGTSAVAAAPTDIVSKETGFPPVPRPLDVMEEVVKSDPIIQQAIENRIEEVTERDPVAEYAEAEEKQATAGLERFCDPDALSDSAPTAGGAGLNTESAN